VYFNFTAKINSPNRNKNIEYWWELNGKYGSGLDLSKVTLSIQISYNIYNGDVEEMAGGRWRRKSLSVWQYINKLYGTEF
jgi:hypothetical protein